MLHRSESSSILSYCPCRRIGGDRGLARTTRATERQIHVPSAPRNSQRDQDKNEVQHYLTRSGAFEFRRSQTRINGSVSRGMEVMSFVGWQTVSPHVQFLD